ncbi:MAG: pirin family protein, partial [Xanthobacteraceae bacterium]|nr:pirin family protein [Xanthobacteraceae bacterium]
WMSAGRGIVHSERTAPERKAKGQKLFGIQSWVALPRAVEESAPDFAHHDASALPLIEDRGRSVRLIVGSAFGQTSPVRTQSEMIYADIALEPDAALPIDATHEERGLYIVSGNVEIAGDRFGPGQLLVLRPGDPITVRAATPARFLLLGGAPMDGPRYIWWNFVSSRKERIEQAKAEWKSGRFDTVPGDGQEFIPLPEEATVVSYP